MTTTTQVFVSFDIEHDGELYEKLLGESGDSGFAVLGGSANGPDADFCNEKVRKRIREADQVIVICSEHTESSLSVSAELRIAQEEQTPYFLLWGRRDIMCTKPIGAKPVDGMYSWTPQILRDQVAYGSRKARADATAASMRNPAARN